MKVKEILARVGSYVKPKVLETVFSKYSGELRVINSFGDIYISTGLLTQSGGIVKDLWLPIIKKIKKTKPGKILILGLSGGTLAKLIDKYIPNAFTIGVEIDPAMIYLGKKYLGLDKIRNLKIINGDAQKNIIKSDVIFIDLYLNDQMPSFVYSQRFLKKLSSSCKLLVINHLFYDEIKRNHAHILIKKLESCGNHLTLQRVLTNVLIIATPKTPQENHTRLHQIVS